MPPQPNDPPTEPEKAPNKEAQQGQQDGDGSKHEQQKKGPSGGFDSTPVPTRAPGYTVKITIHRATNLPMGDINTLSSDPYVLAQINADVPTRHKEDPPLRFRTPTVRRNCNPEWNEEWIVANVRAAGFTLKLRVYDEDPADKDDRLGNVHLTVPSMSESWEGIHNPPYKIAKRAGSKRAYLARAFAVCFRVTKHMHGELFISVECLGRTQEDGQGGRLYTVGPCRWIRHYSPILGRIAHIKEPDEETPEQKGKHSDSNGKDDKKVEHYNFQANQMQLQGPVPSQLYHRYVEFKPFVGHMFTASGIQGMVLSKALHHQHSRVYNFGRATVWGHFPGGPSEAMTQQFLDLVHYDEGGRIYTYVLTLDAMWRFTETGKEFGIDMLSKHTMHSDVGVYIAFSGEFFIRRLKHRHRPPPPEPVEETSQIHPPDHQPNPTHPADDIPGGPPETEPPKDPAYYELVIDNDSGTYRPKADLLPLLKDFLARSLPGLHIQTLDCQKDEEKMNKMKDQQRERKKAEGDHIIYTQGSRSSSFSSSDEEDLDRRQAAITGQTDPHELGTVSQAGKDVKLRQQAKWSKAKRNYRGKRRQGDVGDEEPAGASGQANEKGS